MPASRLIDSIHPLVRPARVITPLFIGALLLPWGINSPVIIAAAAEKPATTAPITKIPVLPASRPVDNGPLTMAQIMADYGMLGVDYPPATPKNATTLRTTQLLVDALGRDHTDYGQASLLLEIGATKHAQGAPAIRPFLAHDNPLLRAAAARAAGTLGDASLLAPTDALLADPDPAVRHAALNATIELSAPKDQPAVIEKGIADADPAVVHLALSHALPANAASIAAHLPKWPPAIQAEALRALGRIKATEQAGVIVPFLTASIPLRVAAIDALGDIGATNQTNAILKELKDEHPTIRRGAVVAMSQLADPATQQQHALTMLSDGDPTVREAAARIFKSHPYPASLELLTKQLYDPYRPLHDAARESLAAYSTPQMRERIITIAAGLLAPSSGTPDPERQQDGSYLLGAMKSETALDAQIALLTFKSPSDRMNWPLYTQAIWSLARIGNPAPADRLLALLNNVPVSQADLMGPRGAVSTDAGEAGFYAAACFKYRAAIPAIKRVINGSAMEQSPDMRAAAVWALGNIAAPGDSATNQMLIAIAKNINDVSPARFEAIKCLVIRKTPGAQDIFKALATEDMDPLVRFAAHWAYEHVSGQTIPYTPPTLDWTAATSITDESK